MVLDLIVLVSLGWLFIGLPFWAFIHCLASNSKSYKAKIFWSLTTLLIPALGAILYGLLASKKTILKRISFFSLIGFIVFAIMIGKQIGRVQAFSSMDTSAFESVSGEPLYEPNPTRQIPNQENAATYYLKALNRLQYPNSETHKDRIKRIVQGQWEDPTGNLGRLISANRTTFNYVDKALQYPDCDFTFGKQARYRTQKKLFQYGSIIELTRLIVLKGKYHEKLKKYKRARDEYLRVFKMALHVAQDDEGIAKAMALAQIELALSALDSIIKKGRLRGAHLDKVETSLNYFKNAFSSPSQYVNSEEEFFNSIINMLADGMIEQKEQILPQGQMTEEELDYFAKALRQNANQMADHYYGNFAIAADSNKPEDWLFAEKEFEALKMRYESSTPLSMNVAKAIFYGMVGHHEKYSHEITKFLTEILLIISLPDMKSLAQKQHKNYRQIDQILVQISRPRKP